MCLDVVCIEDGLSHIRSQMVNKSETAKLFEVALAKMDKIVLYMVAIK